MEMITAYLAGIIVLIGMFAVRVPHENARTVFVLGLIWPVSILSILFLLILNATGWNFEVAPVTKMFGFRRPTNPKARGFAVTLFTVELQFFKGL